MTYAQRNAIANPAAGLIVFCTDCGTVGEMQYFNGYQWKDMTMGEGSSPIIVNTLPVANIARTTAVASGSYSSLSIAAYTAIGFCWSTSPNPTILLDTKALGNVTQSGTQFTANITGLLPNTTYYLRAFVTNSNYDQNWGNGAAYGQEVIFTTLRDTTPIVNTVSISNVYSYSAVCTGIVSDSGGLAVTSRGFCWSKNPNPTIQTALKNQAGSGMGDFSAKIPNLTGNTTYYVRPYATNAAGTSYGAELIFTTLIPLEIGQVFAGGIIFHLDSTGRHGIVVAPRDTIFSNWEASASFCDQLVLNGYNDWYLPSVGEINSMYNNFYIGTSSPPSFRIPLADQYWSSSEIDSFRVYVVEGLIELFPHSDDGINWYWRYFLSINPLPRFKNDSFYTRPFRKF
jgi:hypothetical protein